MERWGGGAKAGSGSVKRDPRRRSRMSHRFITTMAMVEKGKKEEEEGMMGKGREQQGELLPSSWGEEYNSKQGFRAFMTGG